MATHAVTGGIDARNVAHSGGDAREIEKGPHPDFAEIVEYGRAKYNLWVESGPQGQVDRVNRSLEWQSSNGGIGAGKL